MKMIEKVFPPKMDMFKQNVHFFLEKEYGRKNYIGTSCGAFLTVALFLLSMTYFIVEYNSMMNHEKDRYESQKMHNDKFNEFFIDDYNFLPYLEIHSTGQSLNGFDGILDGKYEEDSFFQGRHIAVNYEQLRQYI